MKVVVTNDTSLTYGSPVLTGVVRELAGAGTDVRIVGLDSYRTGQDLERLTEALADTDTVIALGDPARTREIVDAAASAGVRRFVLRSSATVYGSASSPRAEQHDLAPATAEARAFVTAEVAVQSRAHEFSAGSLVVRAAPTAGRLGTDSFTRRLYKRKLSGIGTGDYRWQFVHHEDRDCCTDR